jgi:exopolysaccharide biosynthesis polyprenyl glycosylphosphotransferase
MERASVASGLEQRGDRQTLQALAPGTVAERREFSILRRRGPWRDALRRRMLAAADVIGVVAALVLAAVLGKGSNSWLLWTPVTWAAAGTVATIFGLSLTPAEAPSAADAVRLWLGTVVTVTVLRATARALWRRITPPEHVVLMGSGPLEQATRRKLELFRDMHLKLVGTVDEQALSSIYQGGDGVAAIIPEATRGRPIERLILAAQTVDEDLIAELVAYCRRGAVKLSVVPPARGMFGTAVELNHVADLPMVAYNTWDVPRSTVFLKRVIDVTASAAALILLSPVLAAVALLIRLDGGPSLFTQRRAGLDGKPFWMFKFRTMTKDAERRLGEVVRLEELTEPMFKLREDPRVTRLGRRLRRWSFDELPQLLNVLRGDMSLVGPRPEQVELVERYEPEQRIRLSVKPGLTGPMQVFGRGNLGFDERLAVERDYIENLSLRRDLRILLMTGSAVLRGQGAF